MVGTGPRRCRVDAAASRVGPGGIVRGVTPSVRFHATPVQVLWGVLPTVLTCVLIVLFMARVQVGSGLLAVAGGWTVFAAGVLFAVVRWRGLELTDTHAVIRENRTRRIPWSEVTGVRESSRMGRRSITLDLARGRVHCSAPATGFGGVDPDFDEKVAYVHRWWLRATPPDPTGGPEPRGTALGWGIPVLSDEIGP